MKKAQEQEMDNFANLIHDMKALKDKGEGMSDSERRVQAENFINQLQGMFGDFEDDNDLEQHKNNEELNKN